LALPKAGFSQGLGSQVPIGSLARPTH